MLKDLCFEIIQTCPNNCLFCSSFSDINCQSQIDFATFKKTIDYLVKIGGIEEVSLSGGEPFLHPDLFKMIAYLKSLNIRVVLFTSGIKLSQVTKEEINSYLNQIDLYCQKCRMSDDERHRIITRYQSIFNCSESQFTSISKEELSSLKELGLDKIVFDYQSASEENFKNLMGKNHFTFVSKSIISASLVGLETDIHFIPLKTNYQEFPDLIELLNIAGVNNLSILNFVPQGRGKQNKDSLMLSEQEMLHFKEIFNESKAKFNGHIRVGIPLISDDKHLCTAGLDKIVIKYDGTVLPCPAFKEYDVTKLNQLGIKTPNIYTDLESLEIHSGTREKPLCKKLYQFTNNLISK